MNDTNVIWIILFTIIINVISELLVIYLVHKFIWTKKRIKWKIEWDLKNSALIDDEYLDNIGKYSGLLESVKKRYDNLKELNLEFGYQFKKLSKLSHTFLQEDLKPFLSKYHPLSNKLDSDDKLRKNFLKDFEEIRKKTSIFLSEI